MTTQLLGQDGHRVGPWIQAASGIAVDLDDPLPQQIKLDDIVVALSKLNRWTGHTASFYSVAEHSIVVAQLVLQMIPAGEDAIPYVRAALMHDAHEAYCGDISSPLKTLLPQIKGIQRKLQITIDSVFGLMPTPHVVIQADLMALTLEREQLMGPSQRNWGWESPKPIANIDLECMTPGLAAMAFRQWLRDYGIKDS